MFPTWSRFVPQLPETLTDDCRLLVSGEVACRLHRYANCSQEQSPEVGLVGQVLGAAYGLECLLKSSCIFEVRLGEGPTSRGPGR